MKDLARVYIKAGDGGNGSVHFRREKYIPKGGPDGGDGGKGGDVIMVADANISSLVEYNYQRKFEARNGRPGSEKKSSGRNAGDIVVRVPVGTEIYLIPAQYMELNLRKRENLEELLTKRELLVDLKEDKQEYVVGYGGKGGRGNDHFKSSTNQAPMEAEDGVPGEEKYLLMELKVVADVGIMGLPNVGKSSLLKALTAANPKIAGYPFTTLEPNLGVLKTKKEHLILVDIPGVIEEAWEGKGIGPWFLKHLERTSQLIHVLAPDVEMQSSEHSQAQGSELVDQLVRNYEVVREELKKFGQGLADKPEIVVVNKMEMITEKSDQEEIVKKLGEKIGKKILLVSAGMKEGMEELIKEL